MEKPIVVDKENRPVKTYEYIKKRSRLDRKLELLFLIFTILSLLSFTMIN